MTVWAVIGPNLGECSYFVILDHTDERKSMRPQQLPLRGN